MSHIALLDPLVAQRIAAGEVIERPQSVARELLDNAIDAGATDITLSIDGGGIDRIRVSDNGSGIAKDELPLTTKRHATSKVHTLDDLYHLSSMGFRGEALYSIAAVSKLTISSQEGNNGAFTYIMDNGKEYPVTPGGPDKGTAVSVENLFFEIPARRSFLKRPQSEGTLCRNALCAKAMAAPHIHFTFIQDGNTRLDLPIRKSIKDRVLDILTMGTDFGRDEFIDCQCKGEDYSIYLVAGLPSLRRSDRACIKIYVNSRPIEEMALVQAVTYGYGELLPGGSFPYAYVFIEDNPELVDFNIHPAKKEAKLRNRAELHHAIVSLIAKSVPRTVATIRDEKDFQPLLDESLAALQERPTTHSYTKESGKNNTPYQGSFNAERVHPFNESAKPKDNSWLEKAKEIGKAATQPRATSSGMQSTLKQEEVWDTEDCDFTYLGQAFNLFLIAEKGGKLFLVDQHAAHERVLYDELLKQKNVQKLLVPVAFEVDRDVDDFLLQHSDIYTQFGIMVSQKESLLWELTSLPALCRNVEMQIVDFIKCRTGDEKELESAIFAIIACKAAIKAGDKLDPYSAEALLEKTFKLEDPCCPHGRTFIITLEEEELRKMVGRTK